MKTALNTGLKLDFIIMKTQRDVFTKYHIKPTQEKRLTNFIFGRLFSYVYTIVCVLRKSYLRKRHPSRVLVCEVSYARKLQHKRLRNSCVVVSSKGKPHQKIQIVFFNTIYAVFYCKVAGHCPPTTSTLCLVPASRRDVIRMRLTTNALRILLQ